MMHSLNRKDFTEAATYFERLQNVEKTKEEEVYNQAVEIYKNLELQSPANSLRRRYAQKMLKVYDTRMQHFPSNSSLSNRKLFDYFLLMHQIQSEQHQLFQAYQGFFQGNCSHFEKHNVIPMADLARRMKKSEAISEAEFLSIIHDLYTYADSLSSQKDTDNIRKQLDAIAYS